MSVASKVIKQTYNALPGRRIGEFDAQFRRNDYLLAPVTTSKSQTSECSPVLPTISQLQIQNFISESPIMPTGMFCPRGLIEGGDEKNELPTTTNMMSTNSAFPTPYPFTLRLQNLCRHFQPDLQHTNTLQGFPQYVLYPSPVSISNTLPI